jgi:hypothetical protein
MLVSDYIALAAVIISIIAIVISLITSTKKYELSSELRREIIDWYSETVELLIKVRGYLDYNHDFDKVEYLAHLSALIEKGRFYFPNVDKKDGFGADKPSAYRGYRDITLEFLVFSFDIIKTENAKDYTNHLAYLQRLFTSRIFDMLSPKKFNKIIGKNTLIPMDREVNSVDFMKSQPDMYFTFYYNGNTKYK